jgi:homocysteine S-methyltransferase
MNRSSDPLRAFLDEQGVVILDGGLATELEARGYDLKDPLWSARLLIEAPEAIRRLHLDYLLAGADCIISASYQATPEGFMKRGLSERQARDLLLLSVRLALEARQEFWESAAPGAGRRRPLVAASVGPYGAYLANGSEYTGDYGRSEEELLSFHRWRWQVLATSGADLLACETIPSFEEARALARLLGETPEVHAWLSFSCRDGERLRDGTPLKECARLLAGHPQVVALGVNCTAPAHLPELLRALREVTEKPLIAYPNSGEGYDAAGKRWIPSGPSTDFASLSPSWRACGARLIGGCCRTGPEDIREIRRRLLPERA